MIPRNETEQQQPAAAAALARRLAVNPGEAAFCTHQPAANPSEAASRTHRLAANPGEAASRTCQPAPKSGEAEPVTYRAALKSGEAALLAADIPDAVLDAWYLLEYALKHNGAAEAGRAWYYLHAEEKMPRKCQEAYQELLHKRIRRIPLQYITGEQEFMGIPFLVNEHVLIPRQDTETLAEEALHRLRPGMSVLDVCTGSGCIIISLAKLAGNIRASATDMSAQALAAARENDRLQGTHVRFFRGDLFENVTGTYDLIVSNPPYIRTADIDTLMDEVRIYEPRMALDGHADGLYFYRRLAAESAKYLTPGGWLLMEIGADQGKAVANLLKKAGFCDVLIKKDLAGLDRVVSGKRP